jgi:hypothetical protein
MGGEGANRGGLAAVHFSLLLSFVGQTKERRRILHTKFNSARIRPMSQSTIIGPSATLRTYSVELRKL